MLEEIKTERLYSSTHHIVKMWKQILISCSSSLWGNTCWKITNIIWFSTKTLWNWGFTVPLTSETSNNVSLKYKINNNCKYNCRSKPNYAVNGVCLNQFYKNISTTFNNSFTCLLTTKSLKRSSNNGIDTIKLFKRCECMNETELSKYLRTLKYDGFDKTLSWEIHKKGSSYQWGSKRWDLFVGKSFHHLR